VTNPSIIKNAIEFQHRERAIPPDFIFNKFLELNGSGTNEMAVDGTTPQLFFVEIPAGFVLFLENIALSIIDGKIQPERFGDIIALTNGVVLEILDEDQNVVFTGFGGLPAKKTMDLAAGPNITHLTDVSGVGTEGIVASFGAQQLGRGVEIGPGDRIQIRVQDNLLGLNSMMCSASGIIIPLGG